MWGLNDRVTSRNRPYRCRACRRWRILVEIDVWTHLLRGSGHAGASPAAFLLGNRGRWDLAGRFRVTDRYPADRQVLTPVPGPRGVPDAPAARPSTSCAESSRRSRQRGSPLPARLPERSATVTDAEVPVLIVGGGPIGLATSIMCSYHGVRALLVEQHAGRPPTQRRA